MTTGGQILKLIDRNLSRARQRVSRAHKHTSDLAERRVTLKSRQLKAYDVLATERLALIGEGRGGTLGYVDRQAQKLLAEHIHDEQAFQNQIDEIMDRLTELETKRQAQAKILDAAIKARDEAARAIRVKSMKDPHYKNLFEQGSSLNTMLDRAQGKLNTTRNISASKQTQFDQRPLFSYLRRRHYGTPKAHGWGLTRWLDGWVARLIGYEALLEIYQLHQKLPLALEAHADALAHRLTAVNTNFKSYEHKIFEAEGVNALKKTAQTHRETLETLDQTIAASETQARSLRHEKAALKDKKDGPYIAAIELLISTLQEYDFPSLDYLASQTQKHKDDKAVSLLRQLDQEIRDIEEDIEQARQDISRHETILEQIEWVRRKFKSENYDGYYSRFRRSSSIQKATDQLMSGHRSGKNLWKILRKAHYIERPQPSYDDSGWTSSSSSSWSSSSSSSYGGFSSGGGGFRTGGGF